MPGGTHGRLSRSSTLSPLVAVAILLFAVGLGYARTFDVPLLLDDWTNIQDNPSLRHLSRLGDVLFPPESVLTAGRPLLNLSFALNYALGGTSVAGYHAVNLSLHLAAALLLWAVLRRTFRAVSVATVAAEWAAFAGALLWAVHPVQTAAVTYLSQRAEVLMAVCYLATLYAAIRAADSKGRTSAWAWIAVAACWAGMTVKEVMVTAPLLVLCYDRTFLAGSFAAALRQRRMLYVGLAASWIVLAALMIGTRIEARGVGYNFAYSPLRYASVEAFAVARYLWISLWPAELIFDYGPFVAPSAGRIAVALVALVALMALGARAFLRRQPLGFAVAWFFLLLLPTSSIIPVAGQPIAENRIYLPLAAVTAVIGFAIARAMRPGLALLATATSALALIGLTAARNETFRSNLALWTDTVAKRADNPRALFYLGQEWVMTGQPDRALPLLLEARKTLPLPKLALALGAAYFQRGEYATALPFLEEAVARLPQDVTAYNTHAATLLLLGRADEAIRQYRRALELDPSYAEARINLARALAGRGQFGDAVVELERVLQADPGNRAAADELNRIRVATGGSIPMGNSARP